MSRAKVVHKPHRGGRTVKRCTVCNKTAFANEAQAMEGVGSALRYGGRLMRPYLGDCGWWHLTSQFFERNDGST